MSNITANRFDYSFRSGAEIRIGYRSPGFRNFSPIDKMLFAKELGMSVIEPQIAPHEINSNKAAEEYKNAADEAGIKIVSTGAILPHFKEQETFIQGVKTTIEYMKLLGVKYCFTVIPHDYRPYSPEEAWDLLVERTKVIADMFAKCNFTYAIEVDKGCFIETLDRAEKIVQDVKKDNVTINFDPANYYLNGQDPLIVLGTFINSITYGHIKDGIRFIGKEVPVGEGELNYEAIFKEMIKQPKMFCMFVEHCSKREQVISAVNYIEGILKKLALED